MTPFGAMADVSRRAASTGKVVSWPSTRWASDPVGFAREVLGIRLWGAQVEILESIRDNRNTTVRSGHKCGKSTALAVAALWFYCSFDRARVVLTAVKAEQIERVIWAEIRRLHRQAKIPIGGTLHEISRSGLQAEDGDRLIWGITARDGEGTAGISGPNVLVLFDEASGIHDRFFETLGSSLAGSGGVVRKCYISNPTRTVGEFYRSFTTSAELYKCIAVSSEDTPNARNAPIDEQIPGLAGPEWIAEKAIEYGGVESPKYKVRVRGEFVHDEDGKIISLNDIAEAEARWEDAPDEGRLQIGIDPAGESVNGDETAIAVRRGSKILSVTAWRGLSEDGIVANLIGLLGEHRREREAKPIVALDREGQIGSRVLGLLRAHIDANPDAFELVGVRSSNKAPREPQNFDRLRDELWACCRDWLKNGGAIPADAKLSAELNAPSWYEIVSGKQKVTSKEDLRVALERSPDRADAVCLAVWTPSRFEDGVDDDDPREDAVKPRAAVATAKREAARADLDEEVETTIDPYGAANAWGGR